MMVLSGDLNGVLTCFLFTYIFLLINIMSATLVYIYYILLLYIYIILLYYIGIFSVQSVTGILMLFFTFAILPL